MTRVRGVGYFIGLVTLIVLPSLASLTWYEVSKDPTIRPLGITKQAIAAFQGSAASLEIVAIVEWDSERAGRVSTADMKRALINAFAAKGVESRVEFRRSNSGTRITYQVGPSTLGPFPQSRAAEGINAAVDAYRMNVPYKP